MNRGVIDQAPLQLYSSALIFAPYNSKVRQSCGSYPDWILSASATLTSWNSISLTIDCGSRILTSTLSTSKMLLATLRERNPSDQPPFQNRAETDFSIRIWNLITGEEVQEIIAAGVHRMAFMPGDDHIAVLTKSGTLSLWNIRSGLRETSFATSDGNRTAVTQLETCAISSDGRFEPAIATLDWFERHYIMSVWDAASGRILRKFDLKNPDMSYLSKSVLSPDASLIALYGNELRVRDTTTQETLLMFQSPVHQVLFSRDAPIFVAELENRDTIFWDTNSWSEILRLGTSDGKDMHAYFLALSPDGSKFAYCYSSPNLDLALEVWDVKKSKKVLSRRSTLKRLENFFFISAESLAVVDSVGAIVTWDLSVSDSGNYVFPNSDSSMTTSVLSRDRSLIAIGLKDGTVSVRQVHLGEQPTPTTLHTDGAVERMVFAPGNVIIAIYSFLEGRSTWTLWDIWTGDKIDTFKSLCLAFSPDASYLVVQSDRGICAQKTRSQDKIWELQQSQTYGRAYRSVVFSDDGLLIAVTFGDVVNGGIEVRRAQTGDLIRKIVRKTDKYYIPATLSPGGNLLALQFPKLSGYEHFDCFRVHDISTGVPILEIQPLSESRGYFLNNGGGLQTDEETFYFDKDNLSSGLRAEKRTNNIYIKSDWIRYGQHNLLWLGPDFRSRLALVCGNKILIVRSSGDVAIIEFDGSKLLGTCLKSANLCSECVSEARATFCVLPSPETPEASEDETSPWDPTLVKF